MSTSSICDWVRRPTIRVTTCVFAWLLTATTFADWPQTNGPFGNFTPRQSGAALVTDLAVARVAWTSEDGDLGYGKGSVSGYLRHLAVDEGHPGSCSGPIVADGKVFVSTFRPAGTVWADSTPQLKSESGQRFLQEHGEQLRSNLRIDADDLLVCMDRKTGKTLWKAIEAGKGVNRYMGKREGFGVGPAWHAGRVISMGTTGRINAYSSDTGEKLWETDIGRPHAELEAHKQECLAERKLPKSQGWDASLVVADGVLIVPVYDHSVDISLRGVGVDDGSTSWELPAVTSRYATPSVFTYDDKQYVLAANRSGEMRLIEPRTGKVLWTVENLAPTWFALTPSQSHVLVNVGSKTLGNKGTPFGLLAAYEISPKGARRAWTMPDRKEFWFENHMDSCARRKIALRDGKVYFVAANKVDGRTNTLSILDEATGEVLHQQPWQGDPFLYLIEDRLLHIVDGSHSDRLTMQLFSTGPNNFLRLCEPWKPPQKTTTAYEVYMELPYVDGLFLMRTHDGHVRCYDLRKQPAG